MECAYHSEVEAVGSCVNCGRLICAECKVVLGEKTYCNPCADKLFTSTSYRAKGPIWFERHLNWTVVLATIAVYPLAFVAGFLLASVDPTITDEALEGIGILIALVVVLSVGGWALNKKRRSWWWLLILFVPFGWIVFLALENRSQLPKLLTNK